VDRRQVTYLPRHASSLSRRSHSQTARRDAGWPIRAVSWFEWKNVKASPNQTASKGNNTCPQELNLCMLEASLEHCSQHCVCIAPSIAYALLTALRMHCSQHCVCIAHSIAYALLTACKRPYKNQNTLLERARRNEFLPGFPHVYLEIALVAFLPAY
jgi:hypothetical protein